ncbi:hypothetical protein RHBI111906_01500 [Rhodothermus bifroesti]|nr:hypothetical protein HRbin18_00148 [bacterium HR18]
MSGLLFYRQPLLPSAAPGEFVEDPTAGALVRQEEECRLSLAVVAVIFV